MTTLDPPDRAMRRVLLALAVFFTIIALILLRAAMNPAPAGALSYGSVCYEDREETWLEFSRTIVVAEEETATEHQLAKFTRERTKDRGAWSDWSEPVVWEPLSHETWVTEIPEPDWQPHASGPKWERQWALLPTGYTDTIVVTPEVTETETEWFASPPEDDWTPTGNSRTEWIEVEVPCPPLCACLPVEDMPCDLPPECAQPPACPGDPECEAPKGPETPPATIDHGPEPEADHTIPPTDPPVEEVVTSSISTDRPTLPRTGVKEDIASVGLVLLFVGGSLLGIEAYDRRKRREA